MTSQPLVSPGEKLHLKIGGMQCSFCVESIRKAYERLDGVDDVAVSLSHEEALVRYDARKVTPTKLRETLTSLGFTVRDPDKVRAFEEEAAEIRHHRKLLIWAAAMMGCSLAVMAAMWLGIKHPWFKWIMLGLSLGMVFGVGRSFLSMAWAALRRGILNQHVLMEFGAFGGLAGGIIGFFKQPWPTGDFLGAAVFITAYHILSAYVSVIVRTKSSQAIKKLMALQPATARVVRDGKEEEIPVEAVQPDDLVRIRPGESIPVDGVVVEGFSAVNQSLVTGEPLPLDRTVGDEVIGGSVNQTGSLLVRVTRVGEESFLQQVAHAIQEARALKPGIIQLVERVLGWFVPGVLGAAAAAFLIWTLGAWLLTGAPNFNRAIFAAMAALVMGYPCALGMATPLAMIRGGGMAAQRGILMRSGEAFQVLKDVRKVVLDKTGTITRGKPQVVEVAAAEGSSEGEVLALAAAAESSSEHPLGRAIVERAGAGVPAAGEFQAVPGGGVRARVNTKTVLVGNARFLVEEGVDVMPLQGPRQTMERQGWTVVAVAEDGRAAGLIAIADTVKDDAAETVRRLKEAGLQPLMVTGDNLQTARAIAEQVGITEVLAEVLPAQKAEKVRRLQQEGWRVIMVGDGINDAPALMQADVGVAMGAGTDIAIESADIILVGERLSALVDAYHIGTSSFRKTVQNVVLAFLFNGLGVPAAVTGIVHPAMAMLAMAASVTTVLLNSFGGQLMPTARRGARAFEETTIPVPSMHCEGCIETIREALIKRGADKVTGDATKKVVTVRYEKERLDEEAIREGIVKAGFVL